VKHYPLSPQVAWILQQLAKKANQRNEDYLRDLLMKTYQESINQKN